MLLDEHMSGAQIDIASGSDKNFTTSLLAGRYNPGHDNPDILPGQTLKDFTADFYATQFNYNVGGLYRFDNNWGLLGQYAVNTESDNSDDKQAYMAELQYKNANITDPGSWGAYVAYRHFGKDVTIATTYKDVFNNQKGFAIGASYVPVENLLASVKYFDGKDIDSDTDADRFYLNLDFFY